MNRLPPQRWTHEGQTYSVALYVDGKEVVGMTPVKVVTDKGCKSCGDKLRAAKELVSA